MDVSLFIVVRRKYRERPERKSRREFNCRADDACSRGNCGIGH
jgi:hypothetical protein